MIVVKRISRLALLAFMLLLTGCPSFQHVDSLYGVKVVGDGHGGALAVFEDKLGGSVYVQKISSEGKSIWTGNGVVLGKSDSQSYEISTINMVHDGSGGALISWYSFPVKNSAANFVFHVIRLSSTGQMLWQKDVERVDQMKGDDSGGAAMGYVLNGELYANAVDAEGKLMNPVATRIGPTSEGLRGGLGLWQMVADAEGGAIFVWDEHQYPPVAEPGKTTSSDHLFAQRIDAQGKLLWGDPKGNGQSVYFPPTGTSLGTLLATGDGKGGALLSWFQLGSVVSDNSGNRSQRVDLVVQKLDAKGQIVWGDDGTQLAIEQAGGRPVPSDGSLVTDDGAGGIIVGWRDLREIPGNPALYAQRVNAAGQVQWPPAGVKVSATSLNPRTIVAGDGSRGAIAAYWYQQDNKMINVQKIDSSGTTVWQPDGVTVARGDFAAFSFAADGQGGAVLGWGGGGVGSEKAYIQRLNADGKPMWGQNGILLNGSGGRK